MASSSSVVNPIAISASGSSLPAPTTPASLCKAYLRHGPTLTHVLTSRKVSVGCPRQQRVVVRAAKADAASEIAEPATPKEEGNWVPIVPFGALPKGERRLIRQDDETVLLLWYKNDIYAIENSSPAEGAYSEGLVNARLTQDGCIVCPTTDSTFDLKTGKTMDWYPNNPVLRVLQPPLRDLMTYPVKVESGFIFIDMVGARGGESAEIIFRGQVQAGRVASNVDVDEVRMVVDENELGFGFTPNNELTNGRAAMIGFACLLLFELVTGKGLLQGTGFLGFLYQYLPDFPILRY